jgi:hypothetical protein
MSLGSLTWGMKDQKMSGLRRNENTEEVKGEGRGLPTPTFLKCSQTSLQDLTLVGLVLVESVWSGSGSMRVGVEVGVAATDTCAFVFGI